MLDNRRLIVAFVVPEMPTKILFCVTMDVVAKVSVPLNPVYSQRLRTDITGTSAAEPFKVRVRKRTDSVQVFLGQKGQGKGALRSTVGNRFPDAIE